MVLKKEHFEETDKDDLGVGPENFSEYFTKNSMEFKQEVCCRRINSARR